jgi:hypothetical protein
MRIGLAKSERSGGLRRWQSPVRQGKLTRMTGCSSMPLVVDVSVVFFPVLGQQRGDRQVCRSTAPEAVIWCPAKDDGAVRLRRNREACLIGRC